MSFSSRQLAALQLLVSARLNAGGAADPQRADWEGLLEAVKREQARVGAANDTAAAGATALGELVFAIDLPLQVELPPAAPRPRARPLTEKQLARLLLRQKARAKKGPPKPVVLPLGATLNAYNACPPWKKIKTREHLDQLIAAELPRWPAAHWGGTYETVRGNRRTPVGGRRRLVRLTRYSARRPDEVTIDCAGGKFGLDRIVQAGVLGGDSDVWCAREARWEPVKAGEGRVRLEVFELLDEDGVPRTKKGRTKSARAQMSASH